MLILETRAVGIRCEVSRWLEVLSHRMVFFAAIIVEHVVSQLQVWCVLLFVQEQGCIVCLTTFVDAGFLRATVSDPTTVRLVVWVAYD